MEIKVLCGCGAKYKFPVEPVNGRLPRSIACPVCGADNTQAGNQAIHDALIAAANVPAPAPITAAPTPAVTAPVAVAPIPAAPVPVSAGGGLRIATPRHAPATAVADAPPGGPAPARQNIRFVPRGAPPPAKSSGPSKMAKIGGSISAVVVVLLGCLAIYKKADGFFGDLKEVFYQGASDTEEVEWTLPQVLGGGLLIKTDSHANLAELLADAHLDVKKQQLAVEPSAHEYTEGAKYMVYPALKGTVEVWGHAVEEWQEAEGEALALKLSKELNTYVVLCIFTDVDCDAGVVSIYENGERKFRIKRWYLMTGSFGVGFKEFMEREGEEWAKTHGYVPSPLVVLGNEDIPDMPFDDVNQLVLNLGMDTRSREDEPKGMLMLK